MWVFVIIGFGIMALITPRRRHFRSTSPPAIKPCGQAGGHDQTRVLTPTRR